MTRKTVDMNYIKATGSSFGTLYLIYISTYVLCCVEVPLTLNLSVRQALKL